jgi:hypothetical protein
MIDKYGWMTLLIMAEYTPFEGVCQVKPLLCPGHSDIEQTPFFGQSV